GVVVGVVGMGVGRAGSARAPAVLILVGSAVAAPIDTVRLLSGADPLDGAPIVSRHIDHPDHDRARAWIVDQLAALDGFEVTFTPFDADRDLANVVARRAGTDDALPELVVGAHYDTTGAFTDGWVPATDPAPGADDDASGCAAVLALAERLNAGSFRHPVRLVWFDAEEEGLLGSVALAQQLADEGVVIDAMIQLDPVGYSPGGFDGGAPLLWITYDDRWPELADGLAARADGTGLDGTAIDRALIGGDTRSDHAPFWDHGFPAVHLASFPQPPTYHTVDDTIANVDPAFLDAVTAVLIDEVVARAVPVDAVDDPPPGCGCSGAGGAGGPEAAGWVLCAIAARTVRRRLSRRFDPR
ncbi:MAG: M20/M25/M40 family metallo-hydrolase, partial [Myxococcota bacterium]